MTNSEAARSIFNTLVEEGLIENSEEIYFTILFTIDFASHGESHDDEINKEKLQAMLDSFRRDTQKAKTPLQ